MATSTLTPTLGEADASSGSAPSGGNTGLLAGIGVAIATGVVALGGRGRLDLGTRQCLFLVEMFEPRRRTVDVAVLGE